MQNRYSQSQQAADSQLTLAYKERGYSKNSSLFRALMKKYVYDSRESFFTGALSGGVANGVNTVANSIAATGKINILPQSIISDNSTANVKSINGNMTADKINSSTETFPVEKTVNNSKIDVEDGYSDYLRDIIGSAKDKNFAEYDYVINEIKRLGGDVVLLKNNNKMVTNVRKGMPAVIEIDENASIAAFMHERRHFLDDAENGYPGPAYYLKDNDKFWEYEKRGYLEEIKIAKENNLPETVKKIENEMERRRKEIYGNEEHFE